MAARSIILLQPHPLFYIQVWLKQNFALCINNPPHSESAHSNVDTRCDLINLTNFSMVNHANFDTSLQRIYKNRIEKEGRWE